MAHSTAGVLLCPCGVEKRSDPFLGQRLETRHDKNRSYAEAFQTSEDSESYSQTYRVVMRDGKSVRVDAWLFPGFANRGCCQGSGTKAGVATGHGQTFIPTTQPRPLPLYRGLQHAGRVCVNNDAIRLEARYGGISGTRLAT